MPAHPAFGASAAGKTFPTLTVRGTTYTNVSVTEISGGSVFIRHARGFESWRLESLDANTLTQLGIEPSTAKAAASSSRSSTQPAVAVASGGPDEASASDDSSDSSNVGPVPGILALVFGGIGLLLLIIGHVLFIVAAFRTGPWWGVGVLFGGLTFGLVPIIFFFTHLEECKKAFFLGMSGVLVFVVLGITMPNFVRAKTAALARERTNAQP
jgi:hypothetical protein